MRPLAEVVASFCKKNLQLRAVQDVVILAPLHQAAITPSGVLLNASTDRSCEARVLVVGPGRKNRWGKRISCDVQPGDIVLYEHGRGVKVDYKGQKLVFMREPDITGVLDAPQGNTYDPSTYCEQAEIRVTQQKTLTIT